MKHTYNTGKVQIGLAYEPKVNIQMSRDMLRLQHALINQRRELKFGFVFGIYLAALFVALAGAWVLM